MYKREWTDRLGKKFEVGDIVIVGSSNRVRIARIYGFGNKGQPLCEGLIGLEGKGFLGYDYIILSRNGETETEIKDVLNG